MQASCCSCDHSSIGVVQRQAQHEGCLAVTGDVPPHVLPRHSLCLRSSPEHVLSFSSPGSALEGCSPSSSFLCSPVAPLGAVITWLKSVQRAVLLVGLAQNHGGPPCGHSKQAHPVGLSLCRMSCTVAANFSVLQSQHTYMQKAGALSSFMVTKAEQLTSGILAIAVMGPQVRPCCVRARTAARWRHANAR